uniref:peptidylprolyl isomerase n=1 Tax=Eptatretus burgeri TaxID=7764 RepID=A0A8C4R8B6_EPTBU
MRGWSENSHAISKDRSFPQTSMAAKKGPWSVQDLQGDRVSKKEIIQLLQQQASHQFLEEQKLLGSLKNVAKTSTKDHLVKSYELLLKNQKFKDDKAENVQSKPSKGVGKKPAADSKSTVATAAPPVVEEPPKYSKSVLKRGDKLSYPQRGDTVACWYKGMLEDGTVFDSNLPAGGRKGKSAKPLTFKVGVGKVIKGWDEALMTMSNGEKARLEIESEWAYGKKGLPDGKIYLPDILIACTLSSVEKRATVQIAEH